MPWETDLSETLKKLNSGSTWSVPTGKPLDKTGLSAVLVPIAFNPVSCRHEILLTKRSQHVETHKGQISFPGGFLEDHDETLTHAATREAFEEIGLRPESVTILGALNPVQTRFSVTIYPWIGRFDLPYDFRLNESEVERIITLPIEELLSKGLSPTIVDIAGLKLTSPGIWADGELVWGATAKILEELRTFLLPIKF